MSAWKHSTAEEKGENESGLEVGLPIMPNACKDSMLKLSNKGDREQNARSIGWMPQPDLRHHRPLNEEQGFWGAVLLGRVLFWWCLLVCLFFNKVGNL